MSLADTVELMPRELLTASGAYVARKGADLQHEPSTIFERYHLELLDRRWLDEDFIACHGALGSSAPSQSQGWVPWHVSGLQQGRRHLRQESPGPRHSPGPRSSGQSLRPSFEGHGVTRGPSRSWHVWHDPCCELSTMTSERQGVLNITIPPNNTLQRSLGVGLGADFVRTFARRG